MSTNVEITAPRENIEVGTKTKKSKGSQEDRKTLADRRRQQQNVFKTAAIFTSIDMELGLKKTNLLSTLKLASSNRSTSVHVGLLMCASYYVRKVLDRCVAIAQCFLTMLLTPENVILMR